MSAPVTQWRRWSTPALVTWLPQVAGAGPRDADPGRLAGFARSPEGALAAAGSLLPAIYYTRDGVDWDWLASERVMWAQGARSALEASLQPVWQVAAGVSLRPVGFRMVSYSPQRAQVRLWWRTDRPAGEALVVGAIATVRWVSGDWWLVFDEPAMDLRTLDPARDGYLAWGPSVEGAA